MSKVAEISGKIIKGWISPEASSLGTEVNICVNGIPVATADACRVMDFGGREEVYGFQRSIRDIWNYVGPDDELTVEHAGRPLEFEDGSYKQGPIKEGAAPLSDLLEKLSSGYIIDKYGAVRRRLDENADWQEAVFVLFAELREKLLEKFGLDLKITYGTLLGAVREGDFISHDNDFDTIYVSKYSDPEGVQDEFQRVCEFLLEEGYRLFVKPTHTWVYLPNSKEKIDIFFSYFDKSGAYQLSYGYFGEPVLSSEDFFKTRTARLGRWSVEVPLKSEELLAQIYGTGWRVPDKGFKHSGSARRIDKNYFLPQDRVELLRNWEATYWRKFYEHTPPPSASSFAQFIASHLRHRSIVCELGCGNGRDALFFARNGHDVLAGDRADSGIVQAEAAKEKQGTVEPEFRLIDASRPKALSSFVRDKRVKKASSEGRDVILYMRFFLHSVPEPVEDAILSSFNRMPNGAFLALEFRTSQDADTPKAFGEHYRRFIDTEKFLQKLQVTYGLDVLHSQEGRGFSPYKDEDPHLARIIARRKVGRKRRIAELFVSPSFSHFFDSPLVRAKRLIRSLLR